MVSDAVLAATIGSTAPTLAALLAYVNARAARRTTEANDVTHLNAVVGELDRSVQRIEAATNRVETAVGGLRERLARVEGHLDRPAVTGRESRL